MDTSKINHGLLSITGHTAILETIEHERKHALFMAKSYRQQAKQQKERQKDERKQQKCAQSTRKKTGYTNCDPMHRSGKGVA